MNKRNVPTFCNTNFQRQWQRVTTYHLQGTYCLTLCRGATYNNVIPIPYFVDGTHHILRFISSMFSYATSCTQITTCTEWQLRGNAILQSPQRLRRPQVWLCGMPLVVVFRTMQNDIGRAASPIQYPHLLPPPIFLTVLKK